MMKTHRYFWLMLCLLLCFSFFALPAVAADIAPSHSMNDAYYAADRLNSLGLFQGAGLLSDGSPDYQLGRPATRVEALVMLIRLLGQEDEALAGEWENPFVDVSQSNAWAAPYVGYAYAKGLTVGSGSDAAGNAVFGLGEATAQQYLTFVLRAMGYGDDDTGSSLYGEAVAFARQKGLLHAESQTNTARINLDNFWRADVALVSWQAMYAEAKAGGSLCEKLIKDGVFSRAAFEAANALPQVDHSITDAQRLSTGARSFSFTIVNMDRMSKLWLSDGSYIGDHWQSTDSGWVEFNVQQNPLTAVLTVWSDVDFEHIGDLKVRYIKTEGMTTAEFGCSIKNGGRYWLDEERYNNGGFLMTEHTK